MPSALPLLTSLFLHYKLSIVLPKDVMVGMMKLYGNTLKNMDFIPPTGLENALREK